MLMRMMLTAGIQVLPVMRMIFSYKSNDGRVQKATNTRYSQTSQVIAMVMVVLVTMIVTIMVTMTSVVWESGKCIAHMNHSPFSATLSFYDYAGRIDNFERKILVTHTSLG